MRTTLLPMNRLDGLAIRAASGGGLDASEVREMGIHNIQVSWVKMGMEGARLALQTRRSTLYDAVPV